MCTATLCNSEVEPYCFIATRIILTRAQERYKAIPSPSSLGQQKNSNKKTLGNTKSNKFLLAVVHESVKPLINPRKIWGAFVFARDNCMYMVQESHRFKNT